MSFYLVCCFLPASVFERFCFPPLNPPVTTLDPGLERQKLKIAFGVYQLLFLVNNYHVIFKNKICRNKAIRHMNEPLERRWMDEHIDGDKHLISFLFCWIQSFFIRQSGQIVPAFCVIEP